jgi:hypothetical protein
MLHVFDFNKSKFLEEKPLNLQIILTFQKIRKATF